MPKSLTFLLLSAVGFVVDSSAATVLVPVTTEDAPAAIFAPNESFHLWQQRSSDSGQQMMSYVIQTGRNGLLIVIDGGMTADRANLQTFLQHQRPDKTVTAWFVSHPHPDHVGALASILADSPPHSSIKAIYGSLLTNAELDEGCDDAGNVAGAKAFNATIAATDVSYVDLTLGAVMFIDGVKIEVLGVKNPELNDCSEGNLVNDSSVVLRVSDGARSVLFTGDLGREGGCKITNGDFKSRLASDYVQMTHHGSYGANESFYQAVGAHSCLWPTVQAIFDYPQPCPVPPADPLCGEPPPISTCIPYPTAEEPEPEPIVPSFTTYRTRPWVASAEMCGPVGSGRHFMPFVGTEPSETPYFQEIP